MSKGKELLNRSKEFGYVTVKRMSRETLLSLFLLINSLFYFIPVGSFFTGQSCRNNEEVTLIRKADLENHNKDGGFWTVIDGKVYDIKDFQTQSLTGNSILGEN